MESNWRNKETGEIIRVTGNDDGRTISATIKVVDAADEFSFTRELITEKACVSSGGESKVYMKYSPKFNTDKYTYYNDTSSNKMRDEDNEIYIAESGWVEWKANAYDIQYGFVCDQ